MAVRWRGGGHGMTLLPRVKCAATIVVNMRATSRRCNPAARPRRQPAVHVVARERMRQPPVGVRLAGQQLPERQPAAVERVRRAGHVDAPDAVALLADLRARRVGVAPRAARPSATASSRSARAAPRRRSSSRPSPAPCPRSPATRASSSPPGNTYSSTKSPMPLPRLSAASALCVMPWFSTMPPGLSTR